MQWLETIFLERQFSNHLLGGKKKKDVLRKAETNVCLYIQVYTFTSRLDTL